MSPSRGRRMLATGVLLGTVLFLAVAAVWAVGLLRNGGETSAPDDPLDEQCEDVPDGAERVVLDGSGDVRLGAAVVGSDKADSAVVLRQGAGQTICDWLPLAGRIADETGVRVLLFDRRGKGSSPGDEDLAAEPSDTVTAATWLRSHGADRVGLVGSSMGNSVTFTALPDLPSAPCVLVAVSPVLESGPLDATPVPTLPRNVWVVTETGNATVASYAERVVEASRTEHVLEIDTQAHSIALVRRYPEAADFVVEAAGSCAR